MPRREVVTAGHAPGRSCLPVASVWVKSACKSSCSCTAFVPRESGVSRSPPTAVTTCRSRQTCSTGSSLWQCPTRSGSVISHTSPRTKAEYAQYTSIAFGSRCKEMGVRPSMGTVGDAYDNAMAESFFASLECELIARRTWKTKTEARLAVFTWIESWYNPRRRHSGLNYQSPNNFERNHQQNTNNIQNPVIHELQ